MTKSIYILLYINYQYYIISIFRKYSSTKQLLINLNIQKRPIKNRCLKRQNKAEIGDQENQLNKMQESDSFSYMDEQRHEFVDQNQPIQDSNQQNINTQTYQYSLSKCQSSDDLQQIKSLKNNNKIQFQCQIQNQLSGQQFQDSQILHKQTKSIKPAKNQISNKQRASIMIQIPDDDNLIINGDKKQAEIKLQNNQIKKKIQDLIISSNKNKQTPTEQQMINIILIMKKMLSECSIQTVIKVIYQIAIHGNFQTINQQKKRLQSIKQNNISQRNQEYVQQKIQTQGEKSMLRQYLKKHQKSGFKLQRYKQQRLVSKVLCKAGYGVQIARKYLGEDLDSTIYNSIATYVVKLAFRKLQEYIQQNLNNYISLVSKETLNLMRTPLVNCRNWMNKQQLQTFLIFLKKVYKIKHKQPQQQKVLHVYRRIMEQLSKRKYPKTGKSKRYYFNNMIIDKKHTNNNKFRQTGNYVNSHNLNQSLNGKQIKFQQRIQYEQDNTNNNDSDSQNLSNQKYLSNIQTSKHFKNYVIKPMEIKAIQNTTSKAKLHIADRQQFIWTQQLNKFICKNYVKQKKLSSVKNNMVKLYNVSFSDKFLKSKFEQLLQASMRLIIKFWYNNRAIMNLPILPQFSQSNIKKIMTDKVGNQIRSAMLQAHLQQGKPETKFIQTIRLINNYLGNPDHNETVERGTLINLQNDPNYFQREIAKTQIQRQTIQLILNGAI